MLIDHSQQFEALSVMASASPPIPVMGAMPPPNSGPNIITLNNQLNEYQVVTTCVPLSNAFITSILSWTTVEILVKGAMVEQGSGRISSIHGIH